MTKILVADDTIFHRRLLSRLLGAAGFDIIEAADGPEALRAARETEPDVVLLDITMPGLDGVEVCRALQDDPLTGHIPVIMVTVLGREADVVRGLDAGARDYVTKPFNEAVLLARVRSAARSKADRDTILGLNARLAEAASVDGLTGAKNRAYLDDALPRALALAARQGSPVSLALLDVDRFKDYNDSFGHPAGDAVLRRVVAVLTAGLRCHDVVARYGGEEFAVLMPGTSASDACLVAGRLRGALAAAPWERRPVTASFGVATADAGGGTVAAGNLIERADRALYVAKRTGRDRVVHEAEVGAAVARS